jgi:type VI protein secretion system component VasF
MLLLSVQMLLPSVQNAASILAMLLLVFLCLFLGNSGGYTGFIDDNVTISAIQDQLGIS